MARCNPSAFPEHCLAEATRIAPNRSRASDGICGDAAHQATHSDHNPDSRGIPHAFDVTQDDRYFDAHKYGIDIAKRILAGHENRVTYMVANFGGPDMIFDLAVSPGWRQNGSYKTDHRSHLHVSFTVAAENSTAPFFILEDDVTPQDKKDIINGVVAQLRPIIREQCSEATRNALGGYVNGKWVDGALAAALRKQYNLVNP